MPAPHAFALYDEPRDEASRSLWTYRPTDPASVDDAGQQRPSLRVSRGLLR